MAKWINRTLVQAPRNGTTSHTITFTAATSGNLLVMVLEGSVTHTVPTGWTRQAQALNTSDLAVFTKTASSGESSFSTTHNASNYPVVAVVYEFPAGSTWVTGAGAINQAANAPCPQLTGLTGTNLLVGVVGGGDSASSVISTAWTGTGPPVEDVDVNVNASGTDGYYLSLAYVEGSTAATFQPTGTVANMPFSHESLSFAVAVASGALTVSPAGIATAAAFGTPALVSTVSISPSGLASTEAFGTATVTGTIPVNPAGIASAEAFGVLTVTTGALTVSPTGLTSGETFGSPIIETTGAPSTVSPSGIDSDEAFGTPTVSSVIMISNAGFGSAEAFGTATVSNVLRITATGIPSELVIGSPVIGLGLTVFPPSILDEPSDMGTPVLTYGALGIGPAGIPSAEAFGSAGAAGALVGHSVIQATLPDRRYGVLASATKKRWEGSIG